MQKMRLGRTELMVTKTAFGVLPLQRTEMSEAIRILKAAYDYGINFYDTARAYSNSEEKIGNALSDVRDKIIIASKTASTTKAGMERDLATSLKMLKTDYIDIYQLHNPAKLPDPNEKGGIYEGLLKAKKDGFIRHISITQHTLANAIEAARSGLYDTVQFPLSSLSAPDDLALIDICKKEDVGVIAMKALSGGLITNAATTFAFLRQYDNVVPIFGIQRMYELEQFIELDKNVPKLDDKMWALINKDRQELSSSFCRACGYCMPCPVGIEINTCARMSLLLRRAPYQDFVTEEVRAKMKKIEECLDCKACMSKCPYHLNTPELLRANYEDYKQFVANLDSAR